MQGRGSPNTTTERDKTMKYYISYSIYYESFRFYCDAEDFAVAHGIPIWAISRM